MKLTGFQRGAYVHAQAVAAMAAIEGMVAENKQRELRGEVPAYGQQAFLGVIQQYGLHHNAMMKVFRGTDNENNT